MSRRLGLIGDLGTQDLFPGVPGELDTIYGKVEIVLTRTEYKILFIPRYGFKQNIPPHEVNYRAIISALKHYGVKHVLATTIATRLNPNMNIGDIVIPQDLIDFTTFRASLVSKPGHSIDMGEIFSQELRELVLRIARENGLTNVREAGVAAVVDGVRFETRSEARFLRSIGCDIITTSIAPEAFLAKEAGLEYLPLAIVMNDAADMGVKRNMQELLIDLKKIIIGVKELVLKIAGELYKTT
ncbi:MAG: MTAP family purine nucleoside phosphorylase [Desulfurococcaceae archaeon]